jgi:hypothetical protein
MLDSLFIHPVKRKHKGKKTRLDQSDMGFKKGSLDFAMVTEKESLTAYPTEVYDSRILMILPRA